MLKEKYTMNLLIEGEKVISVGAKSYSPTGTQEVKEIPDEDWKGYRKSDVFWDGTKICKKTDDMVLSEKKKSVESLFEKKSRGDITTMGYEYPVGSGDIFSTSESKQRRLDALDGRVDRDKIDFTNGVSISVEGLKKVVFNSKEEWQEFADGYFLSLLIAEQDIINKKVEIGELHSLEDVEQWEKDNL
jgi:hypothetical protein